MGEDWGPEGEMSGYRCGLDEDLYVNVENLNNGEVKSSRTPPGELEYDTAGKRRYLERDCLGVMITGLRFGPSRG